MSDADSPPAPPPRSANATSPSESASPSSPGSRLTAPAALSALPEPVAKVLKGAGRFALSGAASLYRLGAWIDRTAHNRNAAARGRPACAIVSVGGITVGGAGKTPVAAALARELAARGWRVALASRGYRGANRERVKLVSDGQRVHASVGEVGDEALLLAAHAPGVSVLVGRDRHWVGHHAVAVLGAEISGRDLILLLGGLFLLAKATHEIHSKLEGEEHHSHEGGGYASFRSVIIQILLLDLVFSLDSVITAVGMADHIQVMVAAVIIAILIMMVSAAAVSRFIEEHPTIKMLALSFLLMVGVALVAEGLEFHIPRGYIYFAMAFSVFVEMLNLRMRRLNRAPVQLKNPMPPGLREK